MKLVLTTSKFLFDPIQLAAKLSQYDTKFSIKYLAGSLQDEMDMSDLKSEFHWDLDKYKIFYLNCNDEDVPDLIETVRQEQDCGILAEVDNTYCVVGDPLFVNSDIMDSYQSRRLDSCYDVQPNIRRRPPDFIPRNG